MPLRASIIIPAYNAEKTLERCLQACLSQDYPDFEVIVVDDGSSDATATISKAFDEIPYHHQPNGGPAKARNTGAKQASGDLLVYTDSDCIPAPDWLSQLAAYFEDDVSAVGGTYAIANPESRLARVVQAEIATRHRLFSRDVDFLGSFNVAYRRDAFVAVGGFDETYEQASGEDNDLAYRLTDRGGRLVFTSDAVVAHFHPERLLPYLRTQARHGFWRVKLYRDHPKRATGDHYAGWPDLIAPPVGLALPFLLPALLAAGTWWGTGLAATGVCAALLLFYTALHAPLALRMRGALSTADLLYFLLVACLRDIARGLGLLTGLWTFFIRQGNRAR